MHPEKKVREISRFSQNRIAKIPYRLLNNADHRWYRQKQPKDLDLHDLIGEYRKHFALRHSLHILEKLFRPNRKKF